MSRNNILLVGSDGYIGSNCPIKDVRGIDLKSGDDFLDFPIQERYKVIIFLASRVKDFHEGDLVYNAGLYKRLNDWVRLLPSTHVIYASSAAVYGDGIGARKESDYLSPINLYGQSKLAGEYYVREYPNHTVFRFANVYGQMDGDEGHGVTEIFQHGGQTIFGDGTQVRDFVPVSKIWEVIQAASDNPGFWQGVYNLSLSKPVTINDWYQRHGRGLPEYVDPREGDIYTSILDNSKMKEHLSLCQPL